MQAVAGVRENAGVAIAVMAKAPVPGQAKTRLIPHLGAEGAARLQQWLIRRTLSTALAADTGPVSLWWAGDAAHPELQRYRNHDSITVRLQSELDLGGRMLEVASESLWPQGVLVIGTDCPLLTPALLRQTAAELAQQDAVFLPAEDGGYVLIGLRRPIAEIFDDIDWGSTHVMAQTRQRMSSAGCRWSEPAILWDVDRPADFDRLALIFNEVHQIVRP